MTNLKKYKSIFIDLMEVKEEDLEDLKYQDIKEWDSVGHMQLIAAIEETFEIMLDTIDIIDFNSYLKGIEILNKYEIML